MSEFERLAARIRTHRRLTARIPALPVEVVVLNISTAGCKLRSEKFPFQIGSTVQLSGGARSDFAGQVVWAKGNECGIKFFKALSSRELETFLDADTTQVSIRPKGN